MNIFVTNPCSITAAKQLCGKLIVKMPTESTQLLAFAFPEGETSIKNNRKIPHYRHPSAIWARQSLENFEWLLTHGMAQCEEYSRRYKRRHKAEDFIDWAAKNYKYVTFAETGLTPFARCFGPFKSDLDTNEPDTIKAYCKYIYMDKKDFARWPSKKEIPEWWPEISDKYVDKSFINGVYSKR